MVKAMETLFVCLCLLSLCLGAQIQWTGAAGNSLWSFSTNWLGGVVPTANDDVILNALGGSAVQVSQPATARSITIAGGTYPQSLILLSQLTVGAGGINVQSGGTLQVQSNNNLPLASQGTVQVQSGGAFAFESGAITGPGDYVVKPGATLSFDQAALKLITATNLTNWGSATIQASTIEIEKSGYFGNYGNLTVIGGVNIFSTDTSGEFQNYGVFEYQGGSDTLNLQLNTYFYADMDTNSGDVTINYNFKSNSTINLPAGSTLTIGSGTSTKQFNIIKGNGILSVQGMAVVNAPISLLVVEVSDAGSLTLNAASSFAAALVGGTISAQAPTAVNNLTMAGGTVTGPGPVSVSGYLWIDASDTGNTNNFISAPISLSGQGQSTVPIYLLLGNGGQFHITQGGSFNILSSFNFGVQAGKPLITVDGTLSITTNETITTNVDFAGAGSFKLNAGTFIANGETFTMGTLFLAADTTAHLNTVILTVTTVSGAGNLNLTAAPAPVSSIGTATISYFGIVSGSVQITSFAVTTFDFWSGMVTLAAGSTNTATTANLHGGALSGSASLTTSAFNLDLNLPVTLSGIVVKTQSLSIMSQTQTGTLQFTNGATIISESSLMSGLYTPLRQKSSSVVIN